MHPYCKAHTSHFCPCCKPHLYRGEGDAEKVRGWAAIAPIVLIEQQEPEPEQDDVLWFCRLTPEQSAEARQEGERRQRRSGGKRDTVYDPGAETALIQSIRSCKGEKAVSLMTGLPWTGKGQIGLKLADVGYFYEVRSVEAHWKGLVFRPHDLPHVRRPFILTVVVDDDVTAMGWEWGRDLCVPEYEQPPSRWSNKRWWLKKQGLNPMSSLPPVDTEG
jgi:hypothetical protein